MRAQHFPQSQKAAQEFIESREVLNVNLLKIVGTTQW